MGRELKAVREATIADINTILDIQKGDGYGHAYYLTSKRIGDLFSKGQKFYLAELDTKPVGFACADFDVRTWIHFFSVSKVFQNKGVGSILLEKIINESKARNINLAYFISEKEASTMENFLKKHGFEEAGFHKDRFGPKRDGKVWNFKI